MSKSTLPWFRFYTETINDTKFDVIANRVQITKMTLLGTWATLLSLASKSPVRGYLLITNKIPYTIDDLASICCISISDMTDMLNEFVEMEMLDFDDGCYKVKNWNKRQFESDSSTERVKEYRERYSNVTVTPPDTDTDTDTDTDSIKREEGENPEIGKIYKKFQNNVTAVITPILAEKIGAACDDHGTIWVDKAIDIAVTHGARNWAYIDAILTRWKAEGYGSDPPGKRNGKSPPAEERPIDRMLREAIEKEAKNGTATASAH